MATDSFNAEDNIEALQLIKKLETCKIMTTLMNTLSRCFPHVAIIANNTNKKFLYVSSGMEKWCGVASRIFLDMRFEGCCNLCIERERKQLKELKSKLCTLLHYMPMEEKKQCTFSYEAHIKNKQDIYMIHHSISPLTFSENGDVENFMGILYPSATKTFGCAILNCAGTRNNYVYSFDRHKWDNIQSLELKQNERSIILLYLQGFSEREMGDILHMSISGIKSCKRRLLGKLNVDTFHEAAWLAFNKGLV